MNLYILRHASAGIRQVDPKKDAKRALDKDGRQQCVLIGDFINSLKLNFDVIVSSPLKRATETASLVAERVSYDRAIRVSKALKPDATLAQFRAMLREFDTPGNVLVVGHSPNLARFLKSLISPRNGGSTSIRFRKAAIARLDMARTPPSLQWMLDARVIRLLQKAYVSSASQSSKRRPH